MARLVWVASSLGVVLMHFAFTSSVYAQPVVAGVSGEVLPNNVITVWGSGFGDKSESAPIKFDSFDDGEIGQPLAPGGSPGWYLASNGGVAHYPRYSNARPRYSGDVAAIQSFGKKGTEYIFNCTLALRGLTDQSIHVIGWAYHERHSDPEIQSRNVKIYNHSNEQVSGYAARLDVYPYNGEGSGHIYVPPCSAEWSEVQNNWGIGIGAQGVWTRYEIWHDRGSVQDQRDETVWVVRNGAVIRQLSNPWALGQEECELNRINLMFYQAAGIDTNPNREEVWLDWYWSDLYIDNTLARIEVGNAPVWSDCSHREVQIPVNWNESTISFRFNQGSFMAQESVYLYIVDHTGAASNGIEITIGGDNQDQGPPGTPSEVGMAL